jgi:hypothetical protein
MCHFQSTVESEGLHQKGLWSVELLDHYSTRLESHSLRLPLVDVPFNSKKEEEEE